MGDHTITHAGNLYFGAGYKLKHRNAKRGVPLTPICQHDFGVPATASANAHITSAGFTGGVTTTAFTGALAGTNDVPRNIVAAWTNASVLTVTGLDVYGEVVVESSASGTSFTGKKAFKSITSFSFSNTVTSATIGTGDVLGLPYKVNGIYDMLAAYTDNTQELATSTVVGADTTNPATATTGDVRGTIDFATASNGARRFRAWFKVADPDSQVGTFGLPQFAG